MPILSAMTPKGTVFAKSLGVGFLASGAYLLLTLLSMAYLGGSSAPSRPPTPPPLPPSIEVENTGKTPAFVLVGSRRHGKWPVGSTTVLVFLLACYWEFRRVSTSPYSRLGITLDPS